MSNPAPKHASCPYDGPILEYYSGQFESVYVLLHPFARPTTINRGLFTDTTWPTKSELLDGCEVVTWEEMLFISDFNSIAELDVGLRTCILSLKEKKARPDLAERLFTVIEDSGLLFPDEGELSPFLENRLLHVLQNLGYESVWLGDEFGTEKTLRPINELYQTEEVPCHGCLFTPDHSILVTTHWDSHCSLMCSSRDTIQEALRIDPFEGFFCTETTQVFWGLHD